MMFYRPTLFIESLKTFDKDCITPEQKAALKTPEYLLNPIFTFDYMMNHSSAAAHLANWVINIVRYNDIFLKVLPLKKEAEESKVLADQKAEELLKVQEEVEEIVSKFKV